MRMAYRALILLAGFFNIQAAYSACYYVYSTKHQLLYRSVVAPVDLGRPLSETVPGLGPGLALVFTQSNSGCEGTLDMLSNYRSSQAAREAADKAPPRSRR